MKTLKDQLREWKKQSKQAKTEDRQKREEKLTIRDIENLMGVYGPRYERRRGVWRQN
ncbi:hypothetical protein PVK73_25145 [Bacillus thuringiensis]